MVSTRNHPTNFPPPDLSPTKSSNSTSTPAKPTSSSSSPPSTGANASNTGSTRRRRTTRSSSTTPPASRGGGATGRWVHAPSHFTLLWLAVSLPLVIWDTGYVMLRPHSMPGGKLHWPLWQPYALYGTVDYIYGFPAWEGRNGFTAAQGSLNVLETVFYLVYLWIVTRYGVEQVSKGRGKAKGRGAPSGLGWLGAGRVVGGREGAICVLLGFATAVMTLSKTVLYWANEAFSDFHNIGHNDALSLLFLWIIPNGAWLIGPTYMIYVFVAEILEGLAIASGDSKTSSALAIKDE